MDALSTARKQVRAMNEVGSGDDDFSTRDREVWEHIPYLWKLNEALKDITADNRNMSVRVLRGLVAIGASVSAVGSQIFGEKQMERDLRAINKMIDESPKVTHFSGKKDFRPMAPWTGIDQMANGDEAPNAGDEDILD